MVLVPGRGDDESTEFDILVDLYQRRVFNLIYRLVGDYDEAADLTQDTFVAAYRSFSSFRSESGPYTWLYRIAVNVCKNRLRQRDRLRAVEGPLSGDDERIEGRLGGASVNCEPERALEHAETRRMVEEAIAGLPDNYRVVAVLRDLHGLSYREISEATDESVDVVKTRLARARMMLRKKLDSFIK